MINLASSYLEDERFRNLVDEGISSLYGIAPGESRKWAFGDPSAGIDGDFNLEEELSSLNSAIQAVFDGRDGDDMICLPASELQGLIGRVEEMTAVQHILTCPSDELWQETLFWKGEMGACLAALGCDVPADDRLYHGDPGSSWGGNAPSTIITGALGSRQGLGDALPDGISWPAFGDGAPVSSGDLVDGMASPAGKVEFDLASSRCTIVGEDGERRPCLPGEALERPHADGAGSLFSEGDPYRYYVSYVEYYRNGGFGVDQAFVSRKEPMTTKESFDALVGDICRISGDEVDAVVLISLIDANG